MLVDSREAPLPLRRLVSIALLAAGAAVCAPFKDDVGGAGTPKDPFLDGGALDAGVPCDPAAIFGRPSVVLGLDLQSATAQSVGGVRLSPDSLIAYFHAQGRPDGVGFDDLYMASRATATSPFAGISPIPGVNTPLEEVDPTVTGDGRMLLFGRFQAGVTYPEHLYGATRVPPFPFANVEFLSNVNDQSAAYDTSPFVREDGLVLYFASSRVPENSTDIYRASSSTSGFDVPTPVSELNTSSSEIGPVVSPDDLQVFWGSDWQDGRLARGDYDIWMATRKSTNEPFANMRNVQELNSIDLDVPSFLTSDECTLYFSSTRSGNLLAYVATKARPP